MSRKTAEIRQVIEETLKCPDCRKGLEHVLLRLEAHGAKVPRPAVLLDLGCAISSFAEAVITNKEPGMRASHATVLKDISIGISNLLHLSIIKEQNGVRETQAQEQKPEDQHPL
jgi:hypothetical protein